MHPLLMLLLMAAPASAAEEVFVSTATRNPVERVLSLGVKAATAFTKDTFEFTRRIKRVAIELGAGDDIEVREVTDPFMPKGLERLFEWDLRLVIRNEGLGFRLNHLNPPGFRRISMDYRLRFDPFDRAGLGDQRDNLYDGLGLKLPVEKRGYGLGMSAVHDAYWGYRFSHDRLRVSDGAKNTRRQTTVIGAGYSPLGDNPGRAWNWSMVGSLNWEQLDETDKGVRTLKHGPGFTVGPAYQLGLDWIKAPWGIKANRVTVRLEYADSQIHSSTVTLGADVSAYVTKSLRLTLGAAQTVGTRHGDSSFALRFAAALLINFRNFKF